MCSDVSVAGGRLGSDGWGGFNILVRSTEGVPHENWGETPWQLETGSTLRGGGGGAPIHLTPSLRGQMTGLSKGGGEGAVQISE